MPFSKGPNFGTLHPSLRTKKLTARFYVNARGARPVREWILAVSDDDRRTLGTDIQKVEFGWPIGRPYCAPLGDGLWEVRSHLEGGRIARVIFCIQAGDMILLHGFMKKTQAIPKQDLALAHQRKKEVAE